jgi:hypothetical protein
MARQPAIPITFGQPSEAVQQNLQRRQDRGLAAAMQEGETTRTGMNNATQRGIANANVNASLQGQQMQGEQAMAQQKVQGEQAGALQAAKMKDDAAREALNFDREKEMFSLQNQREDFIRAANLSQRDKDFNTMMEYESKVKDYDVLISLAGLEQTSMGVKQIDSIIRGQLDRSVGTEKRRKAYGNMATQYQTSQAIRDETKTQAGEFVKNYAGMLDNIEKLPAEDLKVFPDYMGQLISDTSAHLGTPISVGMGDPGNYTKLEDAAATWSVQDYHNVMTSLDLLEGKIVPQLDRLSKVQPKPGQANLFGPKAATQSQYEWAMDQYGQLKSLQRAVGNLNKSKRTVDEYGTLGRKIASYDQNYKGATVDANAFFSMQQFGDNPDMVTKGYDEFLSGQESSPMLNMLLAQIRDPAVKEQALQMLRKRYGHATGSAPLSPWTIPSLASPDRTATDVAGEMY